VILSAGATYGGSTVTVLFNEPVDAATASDVFNYFVTGSDGSFLNFISSITSDPRTVTLEVDPFSSFVPGVSYTLEACCVCDLSGDCMQQQSVPISFPQTLIAAGSVWRYLDTGIDPGTAWIDPFFNDSSWPAGPGELGYGDGDEETVINSMVGSNRLVTAYFRHTFNVADASTISGLTLELRRDDGAIVYLNGVEVFRNNMPPGPATYSTLASAVANDDGNVAVIVHLSSSALVTGANVIAAEVHQNALTSSDITFDLSLSTGGVPPNNPPVANNLSVTVQANTPTPITLSGSDPDGDPLTFIITSSPTHGALSGAPPNVTYTPQSGYVGSDSFTFKVNDGLADSAIATVSITVQSAPNSLVPAGSVWKYLDTGIDPGTAWIGLSFDDTSWAAGPAELGYGDGDEATVINSMVGGSRLITAYFRHMFTVQNPSSISSLSLQLWRDDGAIVYLNGVEVFRNNMPAGPPSYSTLASTVAPDDGNVAVTAELSSSFLVSGVNLIAVEVHQNSPASSDLTFDLQLDGVQAPGCIPPSTGLVAWWPFDGSAEDIQGHHATMLIGNPAFAGGKVDQALQFDYVDDAVRIPAASTLDVGQSSGFTIETWIKPDDLTVQHPIVEWNDDVGGIGAHFWTSHLGFDGIIASLIGNIVDVNGISHGIRTGPDLLTTDRFYHVALTYHKASGVAAIYIDGSLVVQTNLGTFTPQTSSHLYIGYRSSGAAAGNRFAGLIDEVSIYNRALSAPELAAIADAGSDGKCKPPPVNDAPTANSQFVFTTRGTPVAITLTGSDPDGDPLTFIITSSPQHGSLSGTPPNVTYLPATNYVGPDSFTFKVNDGQLDSANATVSIEVTPPGPPVILSASAVFGGTSVTVVFNEPVDPPGATDVFNYLVSGSDGSVLNFQSAVISADQRTVILSDMTGSFIVGVSYTLEACCVCDVTFDCMQQQSIAIQFPPPPDPPDLVSALGCGSFVFATFDEALEPFTSSDPFNYVITGSDGGVIPILNASLGPDQQTVTLTVEPFFVAGVSYTLEASFICDTSGDCLSQDSVPIQFDTTPPTLTCAVAVNMLWPANDHFLDVGLSATASDGTLGVRIFSDEPENPNSTDAIFEDGVLRLRARRSNAGNGRVYLIVVTATDACGNVSVCCKTVVVPKNLTQNSINSVNAQAAAAQAQCSPQGAPSTPHEIHPGPGTFDVSGDFSPLSNPAGAWTHGYQATLGGQFVPFTFFKYNFDQAGVPVEVWAISEFTVPAVQHNATTNTVISDGGQGVFPPGTVWFYPGPSDLDDGGADPNDNYGVIRFTVPSGGAGLYNLHSIVRSAYTGPISGDTDYHVLHNGIELFGQFLPAEGETDFDAELILAVGDTIDFVIGRGLDNSFHGSGLIIDATLTRAQ
jgi:hypothetical protein